VQGYARRKVREGVVVSAKMDKTVVVSIKSRKPHPLYEKVVTKTKKVKAHDENNECKEGDIVRIVETRPLSKEKRWRVAEILIRGRGGQ
jgi:small subunit ribosomal protein S17